MTFISKPVMSSDIYYCSEDAAVGFDPTQNYKQYSYKLRRFKVEIDFKKKIVNSKKLLMSQNQTACGNNYLDKHGSFLTCFTPSSQRAFTIKKSTLKFHYTALGYPQATDDLTIVHGYCEKF
tara:strand:+ start:168 stop:533 length:366 start_codon:yes stop_codon:yes gene_type:complete